MTVRLEILSASIAVFNPVNISEAVADASEVNKGSYTVPPTVIYIWYAAVLSTPSNLIVACLLALNVGFAWVVTAFCLLVMIDVSCTVSTW